ncbi:MAG TPA: ROK family transcriptional regulator [Actinomycetota bacterium]|nr:ROK family transcriptional regulator [Actinomycetota bacterium]
MLDVIRAHAPVSRAQIARESGLSKPTVSQALLALERARLVRAAGRTSGGKGPTAVLYEVNPSAGWVVGIDVGRSYVRAAIADLMGEVVARRDERTRVRSSAALIEQIGEIAHGLAGEAGLRWRQVTFAVVGSPGVFEPTRGQVTLAHNLPGWGRQGLAEALERELGTNLGFENDVNLAAVGERWKGLGREVDDYAYLHVGTGVGMGLVLHGQLYRGRTGAAGEIAYLPLGLADPHARASRRHGVLESGIGAAAVVARARELGLDPPLSPKRVFAAARRGDERARRVVSMVAGGIALAIAAVVPILDPELVILGGGIGRNGDLLVEPVRRELRGISPFLPRIEVSALGDDATVTGAVAMALAAARERLYSRHAPARPAGGRAGSHRSRSRVEMQVVGGTPGGVVPI